MKLQGASSRGEVRVVDDRLLRDVVSGARVCLQTHLSFECGRLILCPGVCDVLDGSIFVSFLSCW